MTKYYHAKSDTYQNYSVWESRNIRVFAKSTFTRPAGPTLIITQAHIFHVSKNKNGEPSQ